MVNSTRDPCEERARIKRGKFRVMVQSGFFRVKKSLHLFLARLS